jgi:hypothetical protein
VANAEQVQPFNSVTITGDYRLRVGPLPDMTPAEARNFADALYGHAQDAAEQAAREQPLPPQSLWYDMHNPGQFYYAYDVPCGNEDGTRVEHRVVHLNKSVTRRRSQWEKDGVKFKRVPTGRTEWDRLILGPAPYHTLTGKLVVA